MIISLETSSASILDVPALSIERYFEMLFTVLTKTCDGQTCFYLEKKLKYDGTLGKLRHFPSVA